MVKAKCVLRISGGKRNETYEDFWENWAGHLIFFCAETRNLEGRKNRFLRPKGTKVVFQSTKKTEPGTSGPQLVMLPLINKSSLLESVYLTIVAEM